jgi:hypothetical protein
MYFIGLGIIIILHLSFIGTLIQGFAIYLLFKSYLLTIYDLLCKLPFIGKYLSKYVH